MRVSVPFLVLLLGAATAWATATRVAPIDELARDAELVVLGSPVAEQSFWEGGRIFTGVELKVEDVWTGTAPATTSIQLVTLGGQVGELAQRVDGAAVLPLGSRVVAFLNRDSKGRYHPAGMWQGVFRVADDGADPVVARAHPVRVAPRDATSLRMPERLSSLKRAVLEARREP